MNDIIKPEYEKLIFHFRGFKVMIDADLVKRNKERFSEDFMFELTTDEKIELVTNCDRLSPLKHSSANPLLLRNKVYPYSSVLRSDEAIRINIEIMRAFVRYRGLLKENEELKGEIRKLDTKLNSVFKFLLDKIDAMHQKSNKPRIRIGFKS